MVSRLKIRNIDFIKKKKKNKNNTNIEKYEGRKRFIKMFRCGGTFLILFTQCSIVECIFRDKR